MTPRTGGERVRKRRRRRRGGGRRRRRRLVPGIVREKKWGGRGDGGRGWTSGGGGVGVGRTTPPETGTGSAESVVEKQTDETGDVWRGSETGSVRRGKVGGEIGEESTLPASRGSALRQGREKMVSVENSRSEAHNQAYKLYTN